MVLFNMLNYKVCKISAAFEYFEYILLREIPFNLVKLVMGVGCFLWSYMNGFALQYLEVHRYFSYLKDVVCVILTTGLEKAQQFKSTVAASCCRLGFGSQLPHAIAIINSTSIIHSHH